jgi:hypothetical protein
MCEIPIFDTIAAINGARFYYFPRKNSLSNNIHVNFEIDCADFENTISNMLN